ncbi:MAG: hypothetical protein ACRD2P_18915 [Terriglobia bacterium]
MLWQSGRKRCKWALVVFLGAALFALFCLSSAPAAPLPGFQAPDITTQTPQPPFPSADSQPQPNNKATLTRKQEDAIVKENFKKTKKDVEKLSELIESLKKEIQASNPNVMSVDVVNKASKIEKLAKKIKEESEM